MSVLSEDSHTSTNWRLSRTPKRRRRLLDLIDRVWSLPGNADLRLGQLLCVVTHPQEGERGIEHDVWNYEDAELELQLVAYLDSQQSPSASGSRRNGSRLLLLMVARTRIIGT